MIYVAVGGSSFSIVSKAIDDSIRRRAANSKRVYKHGATGNLSVSRSERKQAINLSM